MSGADELAQPCWTCKGNTFCEITHTSNLYPGKLYRCVECKAIYPDYALRTRTPDQSADVERLREGLSAAIRAANLALFVIRKQGVMPNSSWESGFNSDLDLATAALKETSDAG